MAPSLLCLEESITCFDDDDEFDIGVKEEELINQTHNQNQNQNLSFFNDGDFHVEFPLKSEEDLILLFEKEIFHLPREDYLKRLKNGDLDFTIRRNAIDWIMKVHGYYKFGPLSAYLSVNYLDRFISVYDLPEGKSWMMQLLAISCLSLGAKMEETKIPLSLDLQVCEPEFIFEAKTIQRMELLVLSTLNWRMQSVTPFSFIDYFVTKINDGRQPSRYLISRSYDLILSTLRGIEFLEFRPSEFAAAVAMYASPGGALKAEELAKSLSCSNEHQNKERLLKCLRMIDEPASMRGYSRIGRSSTIPQSPNGVLDAACLSYKSEESVDGSSQNFSQTSQGSKRRKLN